MTFGHVLALTRPRISLAVALAALFGFLLAGGDAATAAFAVCLGSFFLCAGCSALNQVQERDLDARLARTRGRPLPAGQVSPAAVLVLAALGTGFGLGVYFLAGGWPLLGLGALVLLVYNGLYTPLKRVSSLCLLVGGLAGALPPVAGWLAAGASLHDPRILAAFLALYLWQVPHFWLLARRDEEERRAAGLPALPRFFRGPSGDLLTAVWVGAYFIALALLAGFFASGPAVLAGVLGALVAGGSSVVFALRGRIRPLRLCLGLSPLAALALLAVASIP